MAPHLHIKQHDYQAYRRLPRHILEAQERILDCEACSPDAEIPFDWLLDEVTGNRGSEVDYFMLEVARCPSCKQALSGKRR